MTAKAFVCSRKRALMAVILCCILPTAGCGGGTQTSSLQTSSAHSGVSVLTTLPNSGGTGVATNSSVDVVLSSVIDSATLQNITFSIKCGGTQIPGTLAYDSTNHTLVIHLSSDLPVNTTCTVDIGGSVGPFTFSFTTSNAPDLTAPTVVAIAPTSGATGVPLSVKITVQFSKAMDPTYLNGHTATGVAGSYTYDPTTFTATLVPAAPLQANTTYTVTVGAGVKDMWGNALGQDYSWQFTTGN